MNFKIKKKDISLILSLLVGIFLIYQGLQKPPVTQLSQQNISPSTAPVVLAATSSAKQTKIPNNWVQAQMIRVVDGDTIEVVANNQNFKLRYIGVNTPETVDPRRPVQCFGKEASEENKKLLSAGQTVYLEKDISETDKFGRLLRYVYMPLEDGSFLMVNDYLVREGFAQIDTFPPDVKYVDRFTKAQTEARNANRGLWNQCNGQI